MKRHVDYTPNAVNQVRKRVEEMDASEQAQHDEHHCELPDRWHIISTHKLHTALCGAPINPESIRPMTSKNELCATCVLIKEMSR